MEIEKDSWSAERAADFYDSIQKMVKEQRADRKENACKTNLEIGGKLTSIDIKPTLILPDQHRRAEEGDNYVDVVVDLPDDQNTDKSKEALRYTLAPTGDIRGLAHISWERGLLSPTVHDLLDEENHDLRTKYNPYRILDELDQKLADRARGLDNVEQGHSIN